MVLLPPHVRQPIPQKYPLPTQPAPAPRQTASRFSPSGRGSPFGPTWRRRVCRVTPGSRHSAPRRVSGRPIAARAVPARPSWNPPPAPRVCGTKGVATGNSTGKPRKVTKAPVGRCPSRSTTGTLRRSPTFGSRAKRAKRANREAKCGLQPRRRARRQAESTRSRTRLARRRQRLRDVPSRRRSSPTRAKTRRHSGRARDEPEIARTDFAVPATRRTCDAVGPMASETCGPAFGGRPNSRSSRRRVSTRLASGAVGLSRERTACPGRKGSRHPSRDSP